MASAVKLVVVCELKSPADVVWSAIKDLNFLFPKLFPESFKSIEILEGDGKSDGTIRLVNFRQESQLGKSYKSKIEYVDEENKTVLYRVIEGDMLKVYKFLDDTIAVRAKVEGSEVIWTCEYEEATDDCIPPEILKDTVVKRFEKVDAYLLGNIEI